MRNPSFIENSKIKSYVLRSGRITSAQKQSYALLSDNYLIPFESELKAPNIYFKNNNPVILEIGFGMGAATAIIAENNPDKNYLGLEVHRPGIGKLLWEIENRCLSNIRIIEHDAVEVAEKMIMPSTLSAIHIFFPDPWPKKKHHKRRLIKRPFTDVLAGLLITGGYLYMATDWEEYAQWALEELNCTPGLTNSYTCFAEPQAWRPQTKFEHKGLRKNHKVWELFYHRNEEQVRGLDS